jgi:hypothetical protein
VPTAAEAPIICPLVDPFDIVIINTYR